VPAGTHIGGVWLAAAWSLHQEFRALAGARLTPLEVLQRITLNAARPFLKREATVGSVNEGKRAHLVLLQANPPEQVSD